MGAEVAEVCPFFSRLDEGSGSSLEAVATAACLSFSGLQAVAVEVCPSSGLGAAAAEVCPSSSGTELGSEEGRSCFFLFGSFSFCFRHDERALLSEISGLCYW